jgi:L-ascorbate metabolism protein UlaG (beta-lactamase superfamily)
MKDQFLEKIKWLGHDSFRIDAATRIYFDPFELSAGPVADIILISHSHHDHCSPQDVAKIRNDDTIIVTEKGSAEQFSGNVVVMAPGESKAFGDVTVETVPAYNTDKHFHPKANGWLGFIVEMEGVRIYHTGDSDFIPEMQAIQCDIALIPVSGTYVMDARQAVEAALAIDPKVAIPMHYGAIVGSIQDAIDFKEALAGKIDVRILNTQT